MGQPAIGIFVCYNGICYEYMGTTQDPGGGGTESAIPACAAPVCGPCDPARACVPGVTFCACAPVFCCALLGEIVAFCVAEEVETTC